MVAWVDSCGAGPGLGRGLSWGRGLRGGGGLLGLSPEEAASTQYPVVNVVPGMQQYNSTGLRLQIALVKEGSGCTSLLPPRLPKLLNQCYLNMPSN